MSNRIEQFTALVARQPDNALFRFSLAQALDAGGRTQDALEHYAFCAGSKADWMMPRILWGKALLQLDRRAEARPVLEAAHRLALAQHHEDPERELAALLADLTQDTRADAPRG